MKADNWIKFNHYLTLNENFVIPAFDMIGEKSCSVLLRECGTCISVIKCSNCGTEHFGGFNSCKNRWCFNCLHKKLLCWLARLIPIFEEWIGQGNYISMLNFTVRDGVVLKDRISFLENSFRSLYNSGSKRKRWKHRFPGGIRSLEVKLGKNSGLWHPHYHCLVMQPGGEYVKDYDWLSKDWHNIVGHNGIEVIRKDGTPDMDWNGNLFIKKVVLDSERLYNKKSSVSLLKAVCETLKYIIKVDFNSSIGFFGNKDLFSEAYYTLKGKRQTSTWGLLYGLASKADEAFDKETYQQLTNFICQKCGCTEGVLLQVMYNSILYSDVLYDIPKKNRKKITLQGAESREDYPQIN